MAPPNSRVRIADINTFEEILYGNVEDESDLLNELTQLESETKEPDVAQDELDSSVDHDQALLNELADLIGESDLQAPVAVAASVPNELSSGHTILLKDVEERIANYNAAAEAAKTVNDSAKLRRIERGLKELLRIQQRLMMNSSALFEYVPPKIGVRKAVKFQSDAGVDGGGLVWSPDVRPETITENTPENQSDVAAGGDSLAEDSQSDVRSADAQSSQTESNVEEFLKEMEGETVANSGEKGSASDMSNRASFVTEAELSSPVGDLIDFDKSPIVPKSVLLPEVKSDMTKSGSTSSSINSKDIGSALRTENDDPKVTKGDGDLLSELTTRRQVYVKACEDAQKKGDMSKVRRMNRICKQFDTAMSSVQKSKSFNFTELPTPPGFKPFSSNVVTASSGDVDSSETRSANWPSAENPASSDVAATSKVAVDKKDMSHQAVLQVLNQRLKQYKLLTAQAKRRGDIEAAKNNLKMAIHIKRLINSCLSGRPINPSVIPKDPTLKAATDTKPFPALVPGVVKTPVSPVQLISPTDIYEKLIADLVRQVQLCDANLEFFKQTGDVTRIEEFEQLRTTCQTDLVYVNRACRLEEPPPKFLYETRTLSSMKCCPNVSASEMKLYIYKVVDVQLPSGYESRHADIYVKFDFNYPRDMPQTGKTPSVKGTTSPSFNYSHDFTINPRSRGMLLMMKRHGVKFEVYQKGNLLRPSKLLGTAEAKLEKFENECMIHETLNVMKKKTVCGRLVVRLLIREPFVEKSSAVEKRWLVIQQNA